MEFRKVSTQQAKFKEERNQHEASSARRSLEIAMASSYQTASRFTIVFVHRQVAVVQFDESSVFTLASDASDADERTTSLFTLLWATGKLAATGKRRGGSAGAGGRGQKVNLGAGRQPAGPFCER